MKETLKDSRVVLLGEQSHGEGATFKAKVRLIKFLHEELGYEVLSFESGLYDNFKSFERVTEKNEQDSPLKNSIFKIWSETSELQPLLKYIHKKKNTANPLIVTGFDCQADFVFQEEFLNDLKGILEPIFTLSAAENNLLEAVISSGPEFIVSHQKDSALFFTVCNKMQKALESLSGFQTNIKARIMNQSLLGWMENVKFEIDLLNDVKIPVQNPRDLQMARNLIFLSELYP
ncbi:MAG: hypothetical protein ACKO96_39405, partial [Flammeovirgaceae bacterium]